MNIIKSGLYLAALLPVLLLIFSSNSIAATVTLHPSGQSAAPASSGSWSTVGGTGWVDVLDSNDADTTYATACCTGPTVKFYVDMDDPAGLDGATINSITTYAVMKCSAAAVLTVPVGYLTDGATPVWSGAAACGTSYATVSGGPYTTNSVGGALSLTDINNLQLAVDRIGTGPTSMNVTEVYAVVDYSFPTEYYVGNTTDVVDGTTDCNNPVNTTCSLREAINAVNAAGAGVHNVHLPTGTITITGASGNNTNASGDYDLTSANNQTVNFTGNGSTSTIISGGTLDRIFDLTSATVSATFTDLKLMSGTAPVNTSGGCVQSAGNNLSFTRALATGCTTSGTGKGGAVFINSTTAYTVTVADSTFSSNTSGSTGGAISAANVTVSGTSSFTGNSSGGGGGAIYAAAAAANNGLVSITGTSTFTSNTTTGYGGAIYAMNNAEITGATFGGLGVGNHADTAAQRGGAVHVQGATGTFTNCSFTYNTTAGQGGAINGLNAITITNSTVSNNTATSGNGGGIAAGTTLTINATSTMSNNTSGAAGGGAYAGNAIAITGTSITYNTAATNGGGIYGGSTLTIGGTSSISNNSANNGQGGGAYAASTVTVSSGATVAMNNNSATSNGGALYSGGALTLANPSETTVDTNSSGAQGGGIYAASTATVYGAIITNNSSTTATTTHRGGGIAVNGNSTFDSSTISNNSIAAGQGGGVGTVGNFTLGISNSTISGNWSTSNTGGGVYGLGAVTITSSIISSNVTKAAQLAGGVYSGGLFTTTGSTYTSNQTGTITAGGDGAAVYAAAGASITSSTFNLNAASGTGRGGAIFNNSASVAVTTSDSTFTSNSANSGGAIYSARGISITRTTFITNLARLTGGAIYTTNAAGNLYGANTFTGNHADVSSGTDAGGCIYTNQNLTINDAGSVFSGNYGAGSGGCIWGGGTTTNISAATTFDGNYTTAGGGGAIISNGGTMTNVTFVNNRAPDYGGAFYPLAAYTINSSTFEGNYLTAGVKGGGAIILKNAAYTVTVNNSTFSGNNAGAGPGGAISTETGTPSVALYNSTFYNNTATGAQALYSATANKILLYNSIVAHPSSAALCSGTGRGSTSNNIDFNNSGTCVAADAYRITTDPLLSALAYNGGPTKTMAIQTGSPAINASATSATASDQRGIAAVGTRDIGAYEYTGITTLATGTDPGNTTLAPGGSATMADAFTFQTSSGTDVISAVTVTLAAGTSGGLSLIEITDDAGTTVYGSTSNPGSDTPSVTLSTNTLTATTSATQYKIRITPKSHANMPAPAGSSYSVTAYISDWIGTNTHAGSDAGGTTVTIDNLSPANVTAATATSGDTQVVLGWTNPGDADFHSVVVLRRATSAVADVPVEGTTYVVGNTIGTATVACVVASPTATCTDTGLTNGTAYHYKIFAKDSNGNYSATGVVPTGSPATPAVAATTTLATGTDPGNTTLAPGGAATNAGAFSFQTSSGTDVITAATVTLAAGTSGGLSLVEITSADGATVYGSAANPASDTPAITLSTNTLTATTTLTEYRIRITPKSHANMPAPAGASYAVTAYISNWTGTNGHLGSDTGGTTVTIDNLSPDNVTAATATPGNTEVVLGWTNPGDGDLHSIVVLRRATSAVADVPVEGTTYVVGNTIGTATVACVVASPTATCTDTGLTNGTAYHYLIFAKDTNGNYSATGVVPTGSPATPQVDPLAPADTIDLGVTSSTTSSITLGWTAPGDDGSSGTATTYDIRYSTSPINDGNWASATAATGEPAPQVAGTTESFTVTGLSAGTKYYFAMKTSDEIPNTSGLSNNAIGTTNFNGTTVILHPSGAAAGNGATFTGGTAATALDTNDANTSYGASSSSASDFYLDLDDTALSGVISSVQVKTRALKVNTWETANFTIGVKTNGLSYFSGSNAPTTAYALYSGTVYNTNPQSTAAWTWTEINNLVAIINLTVSDSFRATELYAEVAYTPADNTAPAAVTLTASAGAPTDTSVKLTWNAPGDDGSTGTASIYDIRYSTSPINDGNWASATKVSGEPTPSIAGTAETFTVTGLTQSTTYYFAIKTADEVPNWSTLSNSPSFTTTVPDVTAPAAVTLSTGTITDTSIQLNWTAPGDDNNDPGTTATTYDVRYSTSAINAGNWASATQATGEPAPSVQGTAESFTVTGLSPSTTYYFAIKTGDEVVQWSAVSNSPSAVTLSGDAIPPADTIDLVVTASTTTTITLGWTSPGDNGSAGTATTYDVRYSTSPITAGNWASATAATGEPAPQVAGTAESFVVTGLTAGTTYYFALKTSDEVPNTSGLSNNAIGTTNFNGTTAILHPSGANALDGATYTGATAPTALDTNDGNTTYGSSAGTGNDYYLDIDDPALSGTITSVQVKTYAARDDFFGSAGFTVGLRMGGINYQGAAQSAPNGTYALYSGSVYNTNPNSTVAWTWTDINNLIGVVDHTDTTGMRVTELWAEVVYTPGDLTAPAAVTLSTSTITDTTIKLTWTAPGDDASTGTASTYDIRYSTSAINDGNWASATKVSGEPAPAVAGTTTENYTVTGLTPNTTYYFAIKTADEVPNWSAISNSPSATTLERPVGGYTADNVIPTAQVTQATDGSGLMTITWKGRDGQAQNVTLKTFQYSIDGGSTWNAPTNADASAALSANWTNNGGGGWTTATTFGAATAHSFTFNTKHADVTGINGTDQSDIRVRFTLNDGGIDSTSPATSENFRVDDLSPTSTIVSAVYDAGNDRMTITGTNFLTIAAATTDIKSYVDWTKFVWDINGDNAVTANISFVVGDVTSLTVTNDTTLTLQFTGAKGTAIEATAGYSMTGGADTLDVTAGFIKDYYGNAATTDGVANAPLLTTLISGTVYTNDEVTLVDPGSTVRLLINGASAGTAVTDGSSVYRIFANVAVGDAILVYIDNDATYAGTTVSVAGSANITDFHLYNDHIITRHDNGGSLTNANMGTAKGAYVDTDIRYSVSGSALTVSGANTELHVHDGYTFAPGGDVTTTDMTIHGTLTGGSGSITINGDLIIEAGVFTATSGTTTVSGNITNSGGTFTASGGTVTLNGTNQYIDGSNTFNNLNKIVAAADTLYFAAGSTTTVTGTATLQGASGQLLSLKSTVPTTYWNFTLGAASTKAISYVSVTDSDASGSDASKKPVNPPNSTDGGHNVSWFGLPSLMFLKTAAVTSDPINSTTNPKNIPGAEVLYTMRVTNSGAGTVDNNTLIITDPIPANVELFTGNLSGGAPFIFVDGTPSSALSCAFVALGNLADCMDFSNDSGVSWTYVPNGSFDPAVTNIRFSLSGAMNPNTGSGSPYFDLNFRVRVK